MLVPVLDSDIPMKPGSATFPLPGIDASIVNENGEPVVPGKKGYLVTKKTLAWNVNDTLER